MRLNRFLSQCGLGSRRGCEQIILEGRVVINGHAIRELGTLVKPEDKITVDGKPIRAESPLVIAMHKPKGYVCTRSDERDRMTIYDLLPRPLQTLHHVGRLDKESEGLLLLTNRGDLSHHLIHPSKGAEKEYEVIVDKALDQAVMAKLVKGMMTEEGHAKAERAWMITDYRCHVVLKQGLKRQIRLMFYQLGFEVERLTRTRIGWLELKGLPKGGWKQLTEAEVQRFFTEAGTSGREKPAAARKSSKSSPASVEDDSDEIPASRSPRGRSVGGKPRPERRGGFGKPAGGRKFSPRPSAGFEDSAEERPARGPRGRSTGGKPGPERRGGFGKPAGGRKFSPRPSAGFEDSAEERPARGPRGRSAGGKPGPERRGGFGKPAGGRKFSPRPSAGYEDSAEERPARGRSGAGGRSRIDKPAADEDSPRASYRPGGRSTKPGSDRFAGPGGRASSKPPARKGGSQASKAAGRRSGPRGH